MSQSSVPPPDAATTDKPAPGEAAKAAEPVLGKRSEHEWPGADGRLAYVADADCLVLNKQGKPAAEIFYVHYGVKDSSTLRPVTFVFNGGPGAASAYLHVGALGPKRVAFGDDGRVLPPPARLIDNESSWLAFTDLVFVDPVGTGWSRTVDAAPQAGGKAEEQPAPKDGEGSEFFGVKRDLESLGLFISRFLSHKKLWSRPVFIAGESYGGFRVAKLARLLQEGYGVGLSGAILISPALELNLLEGSDYDVLMWSDALPSLAAAALHHGKSRAFVAGTRTEDVLPEVERFATTQFLRLLAAGDAVSKEERSAIETKLADYLGLPLAMVSDKGGRIGNVHFVRALLREQRLVLGLYDASITALDPFADRETFQGADPTLFAIERVFTAGINMQLRENLGVQTQRDYHLLSLKVNEAWRVDTRKHAFEFQVGATDDLRYAMALNPAMKVFVTHGIYDLVTPYFASNRLAALMRLSDEQKQSLTLKHYLGGHMFYAWRQSREAFAADMRSFYAAAL